MLTRIAVLVSGGGTNLQALLDAENSGALTAGRIELVISSRPGAYALTRAKSAGVETAVCGSESEMLPLLAARNIDLIILAGYMSILSPAFTARFPERIINIHPALIPSFCGRGMYGLRVHEAALRYGVKVTGATVHYVNEIPDGGRIILQKAVEIEDDDTPETLQKRVMREAEWVLLPRAAELVSKKLAEEKENGGFI